MCDVNWLDVVAAMSLAKWKKSGSNSNWSDNGGKNSDGREEVYMFIISGSWTNSKAYKFRPCIPAYQLILRHFSTYTCVCVRIRHRKRRAVISIKRHIFYNHRIHHPISHLYIHVYSRLYGDGCEAQMQAAVYLCDANSDWKHKPLKWISRLSTYIRKE